MANGRGLSEVQSCMLRSHTGTGLWRDGFDGDIRQSSENRGA